MKKKGLLITFEGGEGAGKTTLIEKLYQDLKQSQRSVVKTREPGGTEIGKEVRNLLLHTRHVPLGKRAELLLFLADRAQHVEELLLPSLSRGDIVLCDRFNDSSIAYQGGARGIDLSAVKELCAFASSGLVPDLTLYLDLDPEIGFARNQKTRQGKDRIESETLAFHQQIRQNFQQIARADPNRFRMIDASKTPQEVFTKAKQEIDALFCTHR